MSVDMAVKVLDESINQIVLIKLKGSKTIRGDNVVMISPPPPKN